MQKLSTYLIGTLAFLSVVAGSFGYGMNILKLVQEPLSSLSFLRVIGIFFFPLGCVLGFV